MRASLLVVLLLVALVGAMAYYPDSNEDFYGYDDFEIDGGGGAGFGFGLAALPIAQPILNTKKAAPVMSKVRYAQPIVTYAQPIVQAMDMEMPVLQTKTETAKPVYQPTFQVAPVQQAVSLQATAPVIQKGFGTGLGLGFGHGLH
jgi:hypothetical protein